MVNIGLAEMLRYNQWATRLLVEACRSLTDEQLDSLAPGVSGSVRTLLLHVVGGQQTFVLRTRGQHHLGEWNRGSVWPGLDELARVANSTSDELLAIAEGFDPEQEVDL